VADDGSSREVGNLICGLYNDIAQGNYTSANHHIHLAQTTQGGVTASVYGKTETDEEDDEESDDEGAAPSAGGMEGMDDDEEMAPPARPEPIVDEDGFTMVQKKGGRR